MGTMRWCQTEFNSKSAGEREISACRSIAIPEPEISCARLNHNCALRLCQELTQVIGDFLAFRKC